ncbi:citron rho-interacting kinase-like [Homarus americanus]|uniref:citron rho-interacting kinase-like n=1 Tax=Homarus americanus TaxID=6706 RepID=UPI001C437C07|nr:citron rho-interacting kinase-like [Homarus americanus]
MAEPTLEPIVKRIRHLSSLVSTSGLDVDEGSGISNRQLFGQEGLLDALLVLYDECNNDQLKKEKNIADFVDKYRSTVHDLRKVRVNLNDFEQKKVIGKGHFGVVQVVREKATGNVFALKSLRKSDTLSLQHIAFYEEERDIMAKATSPWITQLQYAFQDTQQLYLVMEFHPGGDLLSLLDRYDGCFPEDMTCFYLAEIILAVHALHSMGYVHRDLKPDNILIDRCGHIKLADFGSAAKLTTSGLVRSKMPVGTPDYIAPEVLQSLNEKAGSISYGIECDMWSLGIMAYEMCYGTMPFKGDKLVTTYSNIMNHKKMLKFEDDPENPTSDSAKDLIRGLLEDSSHRLNHSALLQHKFFLHVNWNDLRNSPPPFVPIVNGVDDTSNFEEFENEKRVPSVNDFRVQQGFTGKNLSFIGFTYNRKRRNGDGSSARNNAAALNISVLDESIREPSHLEAQLKAQKKENHELKLQLEGMKDGEFGRLMKSRDCKLKEAECRVEYLEKERQRLEEESLKRERDATTYKRVLALERADRAQTESKTIEMIRSMKNKWKNSEAEKLQALDNKISAYEEEIKWLQSQHQEVGKALLDREKEFKGTVAENMKLKRMLQEKTKQEVLNQKEKEAVKCVGDCESAVESKKKLEEVLSKLETQEEEITNRRAELEKEKRQTNKFERIINEKEHIEEERKIVEEQLQELQGKFTKVEEDLAESRRHFQHAKELERLERQKRIDNLECQLNKEKKECSRLRHQLQEVSGQLNESMISLESVTSTHSLKEEEQEAKIKELEGELRRIASDKVNLQSQLMQVKAREGEHKSKIAELELLLSKLDETVHSLESKKSSTEAFEETYQAKLQLLETQLDSARAAHSQDKEKLKKLSDELTEVKQEISDSKLDVRVSQREVKSAQDTISYLREKTREQRGQLDEKEADIQKATEAANDLRKTIDQLENELKAKEEELDRQRIEHEHFVSNLEEKIKNLEEVKKSSEQYQKKLREANQQSDSLKLEKRGLESQIQMFEVTKEEVKQEKVAMQEKVNDLLEKLKHAELVISQLKQVCTDQDEELSIMESQSEQIAHHEQEMARLQQEIEKLEGDVKAAKAATNEEKSLKLFQESKVKELESRLNGVDEETDKQIAYLNNQLQESGKINLELHEQIENQDKELNEAMILLRSLERKYSELQGQYDLAKEESAGHIQHIHTLKDSNFKLTEGLEEAISKGELYKKRIEEVEQTLMDQQALLDDNKVKTKGTIDQQTKLIDFLQAKIDPKKKKNLKGKLFGGKENKENTSFSMPHQYRELEDLLVRERMTNKQLEEHLGKARAEIVALRANSGTLDNRSNMGTPRTARTPLVPRKPMPSHTPLLPATPQNKKAFHNIGESPVVPRSASKTRMRHNIPHRWQSGLQMRAARCAGCLDSIPFARNGARCHECGIIAHNKCSQELPSTCGLPVQFAEHYSRGWTSDSPLKMRGSQSDSDILIQGWLKMPRSGKACWESCFVRLEEEEIMVFDHEPSNGMQPQSRTKLSRPGCLTAIMSAVPRSELPNTSNVDLPYVLKIEIRAKNMNENSDTLYLMTTNFEEKQSWVSALEGVVAQLPKEDGNNINQTDYIQVDTLLSMDNPNPLDVNTLVYLNKTTAMIGAAEGLYSFEVDKNGILKSRARIEGLTAVHQILLVEGAHVALFIAGTDNLVFMNDLRSLTVISEAMQLTKPNLSPARVEPLQGCHLLASGSTKAEEIFVCAAATDRISILLWNTLEEKFTVCRQYRTQEPCSCLHFTQASLIVGAEKFYEIDLKTFDIEEFLDESDTSLAYAIYGSAQMSSFPVAIMQISKPKKYEEYLLCFHEFAVFVDACGQRSREHDIKFTRLPIAIVFRNPCLYIIHQNAVEVIEIRPDCFTKVSAEADSDSDSSPPVRISSKNMARPSYLGPALTPDSILVASRGSEKLEVVQISANFPEDMDLNSTWGTLPSFSVKRNDTDNLSMNSITSGSSSENELTRYNKRVQFSQTQVPCKRSKSGT